MIGLSQKGSAYARGQDVGGLRPSKGSGAETKATAGLANLFVANV